MTQDCQGFIIFQTNFRKEIKKLLKKEAILTNTLQKSIKSVNICYNLPNWENYSIAPKLH